MLVALAAAAGVAIDNARLYERSQRQRRWAQAIGEVSQTLLESEDEDAALASGRPGVPAGRAPRRRRSP